MKSRRLYRKWYFRFFLNTKIGRKLFLDNVVWVGSKRISNFVCTIAFVLLLNVSLFFTTSDQNVDITNWDINAFGWTLLLIFWALSLVIIYNMFVAIYVIKLCYEIYVLRLASKHVFSVKSVIDYDLVELVGGSLEFSRNFLARKYKFEANPFGYGAKTKRILVAYPLPDVIMSEEGYVLLLDIYDYTKYFYDLRPTVKYQQILDEDDRL